MAGIRPPFTRIAVLSIVLIVSGCASSPPDDVDNVCEIFREKSGWYKDAKKSRARWDAPISVMMATTVVLTDQTIAAIALPHMQGGLSSNQDQIAWVMTTYFMAQAVTTACTGWIAGRIGRKRTYLIALIGFSICSMLSGSATSLPEILIYRAMQGMFSAPVIPMRRSTVLARRCDPPWPRCSPAALSWSCSPTNWRG